jgi:hypothetical protein
MIRRSCLGLLSLATAASLSLAAGGTAKPAGVSPIDGEYGYLDPDPPQWWSCLRCADYRPSGGAWNLRFFRGRMTLTDQVTGFSSHASFVLDGDTLELLEDPVCPWDRGRYTWRLDERGLSLTPVADPCSFGLRADNLGRGAWASCRPPDTHAAVSDMWPRPAGCSRPVAAPAPEVAPPEGLTVSVQGGDARLSRSSLLAIPANIENLLPPPGVRIEADPDVVRYGLYLVLWGSAPWVEADFEDTAGPVGVQLWGPSSMGSASVLFDGNQVWRGEVPLLGELRGQYGGYIEVGGFPPGRHVLRVERLDLDTRPVRVMFFGVG